MNLRILGVVTATLFVATVTLRAEDWTTQSGETYHDVKVLEVKPDYVVILHHDGGGRVPLADLPADLQKRFKYDPVKAKAAAEVTARNDASNRSALAAELQAMTDEKIAESVSAAGVVRAHSSGDDSGLSPTATASNTGKISGHYSMDDLVGSGTLRRDLSDPTYHTTSNMVYTIGQQGLGPDKNDPNHHTMDEIANQ